MKNNNTKQNIKNSAAFLFNTKGFAGTSVREIANRAKTNVSNISYYFENKAGLLEHLVSTYFESYIAIIEQAYIELDSRSARECLILVIRGIMNYQKENRHLTRFVLREITLDSTLIREIMTTYMTKEKYYLQAIFEKGIHQQEFNSIPIPYTIMQLKGMLSMPYLYPQYMAEVLHIMPYEMYVAEQYSREIEKWVNHTICVPNERVKEKLLRIPVTI
ncbi:forespore capture DNA-binding protein RefZ [Fredinandcohnia quinoae]|uniref:Forespore capture DNA-binding protein RefZ n=1 Tax=Fredinandcohnia quinoae TaxID=2918902 RepID=A0AAW5ECZ3_9BACI|nr:forespore capture DNA-binding protein RefZ [Fredinandcohnia sp. SECRCQ15]MCH1627580.1 forespore capture DNA-binding protein RefZ [Fredinandcohnia sp. SECRCQ15]